MRSHFDDQLSYLNKILIEMGYLVEQAILNATKALLEQDRLLAQSVILGDDDIDYKEKEIERYCLKLLLSQQPVAGDLRQISAALKIITDMERIGDQAADISELSLELIGNGYLKDLDHIEKMANETIKMVTSSIDAYVIKDLNIATAVIRNDDVVDDLYFTIKKELIKIVHEDVEKGEKAFDLLQIAKYYERIGDHAVNIAKRVSFAIKGS